MADIEVVLAISVQRGTTKETWNHYRIREDGSEKAGRRVRRGFMQVEWQFGGGTSIQLCANDKATGKAANGE